MNGYGEVNYESTVKSAWCEIPVLGTYMEKVKVDLSIVQKNGKMGVMQTEYVQFNGKEITWLQDMVVACCYDEVEFIKTGVGVYLLVRNGGKQGILSMAAADTDKSSQIFAEELISIAYEEVTYKPGTPGSFIMRKCGTILEYDLLRKEMRKGF